MYFKSPISLRQRCLTHLNIPHLTHKPWYFIFIGDWAVVVNKMTRIKNKKYALEPQLQFFTMKSRYFLKTLVNFQILSWVHSSTMYKCTAWMSACSRSASRQDAVACMESQPTVYLFPVCNAPLPPTPIHTALTHSLFEISRT